MKITRRQEDFMSKLLDLYRESQGPIHYSELAEQLGVNRFTAYDMLRLLEEKGLVSSEYQLAKGKVGPGRSAIVFKPSDLAHNLMAELAGNMDPSEWEKSKQRILEGMRADDFKNVGESDLAQQLFARIPPDLSEEDGAVAYCVEVMTIIALRLSTSTRHQFLKEYFPEIVATPESSKSSSLVLLGGFALGLLANEQEDREWNYELILHVKQYTDFVGKMESRQRSMLHQKLQEVFAPLMKDDM